MAKKKNIKAALTPTFATKTHPRTCKCHKCIAHPSGCKCRHCKWQTRSKRWHRRRRYIPRRRGFIPYPPEDESKVREDIFDKVYKYFEVGTYEAVTLETLAETKAGIPKHPLYLRGDLKPYKMVGVRH